MAGINEAIIAAVGAGGGAVMKGAWDYFMAKRNRDHERAQLESENSVEMRRAELEHEGNLSTKLMERIDKLESKLDSHDRYCDEKIATAIEKSEAECERHVDEKLQLLDARLREEFRRSIEEISEPITGEVS